MKVKYFVEIIRTPIEINNKTIRNILNGFVKTSLCVFLGYEIQIININKGIENIEIKFNKGDWKSLNCKPMVGEMKFKWKGIKRVKENKVIKIIFNIAYTLFLRLKFVRNL